MITASYEINSRSDFLTGSYLIVRIPEDELDHNALHTIQTDCPEFILPFRYKSINGQIEFVYKIGTKSRLKYFSGELTPDEYVSLWQSLLNPLLVCGDWFMNPGAFVLNADYLYFDKNKKTVSYVYIPSSREHSGGETFSDMAIEITKIMMVSDTVLENKVLRSIVSNFNPNEFLTMVKEHVSQSDRLPALTPNYEGRREPEIQMQMVSEKPNTYAEEDIVINDLSEESEFIENTGRRKEKESGGYRFFSSKGKRRNEAKKSDIKQTIPHSDNIMPYQHSASITPAKAEVIEITQETKITINGAGLRYIGCAGLPETIEVKISEGETFTIGRFDTSVGKQQSNFEFDKKTKAISRRHAAIEHDAEGYKIIDLSSSAGTFVDNRKLPPNTPFGLKAGCRISFGNLGADYVWEIS